MPALDRNSKVTCPNCNLSVVKQQMSRHKKSCTNGTLKCQKCPNFFSTSQAALNFHIAKKHGAPQPKIAFNCKECGQEFPGYYALRQHKNDHHGGSMKISTANVEDILNNDADDANLREELRTCKHFLVDSEMEKGLQKVNNYAINTVNAEIVNEKLDHFFNTLKCAAKVNMAFGFILKNIEDGKYRYYYAHENNTLLDRSKLVCTKEDLEKLKSYLVKTDVIETCTRERNNTKWRFFKLTNLTVFAALLRDVPMGCKGAVLPEPLLKNRNLYPLTYKENTRQPYNDNLCLFRALALHKHGNNKLEEETSTLFQLFMNEKEDLTSENFDGVSMDDIPLVEYVASINIFIYIIDIEDGKIIGELLRRSLQKYDDTVRLIKYNNHICYVSNINTVFQALQL